MLDFFFQIRRRLAPFRMSIENLRNIAIVAGAEGAEIETIAAELARTHDVRVDRARELLAQRRKS